MSRSSSNGSCRSRLPVAAISMLIVLNVCGGQNSRLSEYVSHFESLDYDSDLVHKEHLRYKRSVDPDEMISIEFRSHGKRFHLQMERDHEAFHNGVVVVRGDHDEANDRVAHDVSMPHMYHGRLKNDPKSHCFGAIRDGVFDGQITTSHGTYFVERVQRYSSNDLIKAKNKTRAHSVIYHEKHINDPFKHRKNVLTPPGCGVSSETKTWMESIQNSAVPSDQTKAAELKKEDPSFEDEEEDAEPLPTPLPLSDSDDPNSPTYKYTAEANSLRQKRRVPLDNPNKKKSCSLYIQTDPLFWRHIREQEGDDAKTEEEILSLIAQHVKAINRIYSDTSFDGKYKHNGYQFEVQRIKIHNDSKCPSTKTRQQFGNTVSSPSSSSGKSFPSALSTSPDSNPFCIPNVDVSNFLNLHSKYNHEEFCLAYVFTYRDFTGGTLGLAWVASASGASGGICEKFKKYTDNVGGKHQTAKRSLNTGIITFVNYNARVPPKVSQLTLAHEIGHNFGSPHDWPKECQPGGHSGNYIMFASATTGEQDNNNKFSDCSKSNVSAVLDAITDGRKPNCFTESDGAFCGNKIVEEGEECDCGFDDQECDEKCCFPRRAKGFTEEENKRNRCRRRPNTECSPSVGPCCDKASCRFVASWNDQRCKAEDDCTAASFCNGQQATCPKPTFKRDNVTECNQGTQVCQQGECKSSICVKYGLESCFLTSTSVKDKRQLCHLACSSPVLTNNTCMSTYDLVKHGLMRNLNETGLDLRPGSPCDNFQGYCDVFLKCRKVDAEGPLVRLKNLLFDQQTLLSIAQWVTEFWWAVLLMCISFVIFMAIFIRCFAIHTPSSNPNLPKNLQFTETLRRPVRSLQKQGVYVGSWIIQNNVPPQHYRPANSGGGGRGESGGVAPPPYPGRSGGGGGGSASSSGGPGRGYGEGRGHYNRSRDSYDHQGGGHQQSDSGRARQSRSGEGARRSGHRSSRIEMMPMR